MKTLITWCGAVLLLFAPPAQARDWFVREGASGGDGSLAKPFADPWQALDKSEANDAIHVTGGRYFGRNNVGTWELRFDGVQLVGGYDRDFKERDPWKHLTRLLWDKTSKNWPKDERLLSNAKGVVVDGVVIDMRDQNQYQDDAQTGRTEKPGLAAMRFGRAATVRNSVIVNPGDTGIVCPQGSTIENNLIVNALPWGVVVNSGSAEGNAVAAVRNNTIAFTWDLRAPGKGGYAGSAVAVKGPTRVEGNLLVHNDNNGVHLTIETEKVSLTGNVFFMNLHSNLKFGGNVSGTAVDDKSMDLLEESGLKAFDGNEVRSPGLDFDSKWMDAVSRRTVGIDGKLDMDDWNKARQALGLPLIAKGGESPSGVAPAYDLEKALRLMQPKASVKAGARRQKLEVRFQGGGDAGPAKSYAKSDVSTWIRDASPVDGKAVEVVVAIGTGANIGGIPSQFKAEEHAGTFLYEQGGAHDRVVGFYRKGSSAQRFCDDNAGWYSGQGNPDRLFVARGTAYKLSTLPKAGLFIDSIEPYAEGGAAAERAKGRDWFVRAGASGGDGSKAKPFKDPWQALEKVQAGDTIHVAEGEYNGKLKSGTWKVDTTDITLLGGYDKDFTERNPWTHPTRLTAPNDAKTRGYGYTLQGDGDHSGTVVDGFVFDRKNYNKYEKDGDLMYSQSDKAEHVWLARPRCVIRNSVFLNGAEGALRVAGGQTVENSIFINHVYRTVKVEAGYGGTFVFRNNTVLFSWDPIRFGQGRGANGHLLSLEGRVQAVVDKNVFEFADNDAIRLAAEAKDVELTDNTFSKNLWSNVQWPSDWTSVDDREFARLGDLGFKKLSGNQLAASGVPLEQQWFDVYLGRVAPVPGKVQMDDWNQLRELMGQPVIATGGKAGDGFAPAYDWAKAVQLFPRNPKVAAGARAKTFPAQFGGITRTETSFDYDETTWDVAKGKDAWEALSGKRVGLKVVIRSTDNQYQLDDVKKDEYQAFTVTGPEGTDSGGLPMRMYVKKGTTAERVLNQAKSYSSGPPQQWYVVKGVARSNRQLVAEVIERAE